MAACGSMKGPTRQSTSVRDTGALGLTFVLKAMRSIRRRCIGFIESFNNRVRDECLNRNQWITLLHARVGLTDWKNGYNQHHRHSSLDYQTPNEYAQAMLGH